MDELLSKCLSFPPHPPPQTPLSDHVYDEAIKAQIAYMKGVSDSKLLQYTAGGESKLDVINPSLNTVPYTYILLAHMKALSKNNKDVTLEDVFEKMTLFLSSFDARQIRYLGPELTLIIDAVAHYARRAHQPHIAMQPIRDSILRIQPASNVLTPAHMLLVHLALESRAFGLALPVLDNFILYFPGTLNQPKPKYLCDMTLSPNAYITPQSNLTSKFKTVEILEYFLFSGMVYIGYRNWEKAREYLEGAITYPMRGDAPVSKIMVEAYKKWVLVGVLLEGRLLPLPKWTNGFAAKQYHILGKAYEAVASLFEHATASRLKAEADAGVRIWQTDFNTGLVLTVLGAYQKFQIKNLGKIYTKISIPEIHNQTQSAETGTKLPSAQAVQALIQSMISNRELRADLGGFSPLILTFASSGPVLSEGEMQKELAQATQRIAALTNEIKKTDHVLTHDKEYIKFHQKFLKNKEAGEKGSANSELLMDWKDEEDEDLMAPGY